MTGQPNATEESITVGIDVAKHTIEVAIGADGLDFTRESGHQHLRFLRSRMEVSDAKDSEAAVHG
jgi:hypothetical protein